MELTTREAVMLFEPDNFYEFVKKNFAKEGVKSFKQAYELTEDILVENTGKRKYKSYDGFRKWLYRKRESRRLRN